MRTQLPLIVKPSGYEGRNVAVGGETANLPSTLNAYYQVSDEAVSNSRQLFLCKRPPVIDFVQNGGDGDLICSTDHKIRGLITSLNKKKVIWISSDGTTPFRNVFDFTSGARTSSSIAALSWATTTDSVLARLDGISYGAGNFFVATDFTNAAIIDEAATTWTKITDGDFTGTGPKTNIVPMDGYLFVGIKSGTGAGRLYNSTINIPGTWTATGFLTVAEYPGELMWLCRVRNYIVVFKQYSLEFYENRGNPTPGSPLGYAGDLTKKIGLYSVSSVQEVSDGIIFVGRDDKGMVRIYKLNSSNLDLEVIGDSYAHSWLNSYLSDFSPDEAFSVDHVLSTSTFGQSQVIVTGDKEFYTITISASGGNIQPTIVYDNKLKLWTHWQTNFTGTDTDEYFRVGQSFMVYQGSGTGYLSMLANNTNSTGRFSVLVPDNTGTITYTDQKDGTAGNNNSYYFAYTSDLIDHGNSGRKFFNTLELVYDADIIAAASVTANTITVTLRYANEDYTGFGGGARNVTGQAGRGRRIIFRRLGSGRRRAWTWYTKHAYPMRVSAVEIDWDQGDLRATQG